MRHVFVLAFVASFVLNSFVNAQATIDRAVVPCAMCDAPCGQSCGCGAGGGGGGNGIYCPSSEPQLEMQSPTNLFWNDPCRCEDDPCMAPTCFDSSPATIYFSGELVPLFRDQNDSNVLQVNGATGQEVLRGTLYDSYFDAGIRGTLGYALGDWYRIEATYLGSLSWDQDATAVDTAGGLNSPFSNFGDPVDPVFDQNDFATAQLSSELESIELNLRRRIWLTQPADIGQPIFQARQLNRFMNRRHEASVLLGVRYINLDEQFGYVTQSATPAGGSDNAVDLLADNEMVGAQIGLLSQISVRKRGWIDVEVKGGIYQNRIEARSSYVNTNTAGTVISAATAQDRRDRTSWVGELSLAYNHQVAPAVTFKMGYYALAAVNVALATENFADNVDQLTGGAILAQNLGDVIYHGPTLGLVWSR